MNWLWSIPLALFLVVTFKLWRRRVQDRAVHDDLLARMKVDRSDTTEARTKTQPLQRYQVPRTSQPSQPCRGCCDRKDRH